jgi:hypothetical protein
LKERGVPEGAPRFSLVRQGFAPSDSVAVPVCPGWAGVACGFASSVRMNGQKGQGRFHLLRQNVTELQLNARGDRVGPQKAEVSGFFARPA